MNTHTPHTRGQFILTHGRNLNVTIPFGHRSDSTPVPCSPDSLAVWLLQYTTPSSSYTCERRYTTLPHLHLHTEPVHAAGDTLSSLSRGCRIIDLRVLSAGRTTYACCSSSRSWGGRVGPCIQYCCFPMSPYLHTRTVCCG